MGKLLWTLFCPLFLHFQSLSVPRSQQRSLEERRRGAAIAFSLLTEKSLFVALQVVVFLLLIESYSLVTRLKPLAAIDQEDGEAILKNFHASPVAIFRKGFWGLNTLAKLSVYGQPSIYPEIHYLMRVNSHG